MFATGQSFKSFAGTPGALASPAELQQQAFTTTERVDVSQVIVRGPTHS